MFIFFLTDGIVCKETATRVYCFNLELLCYNHGASASVADLDSLNPDPAFQVNLNPDTVQDFDDQKLKKYN
jgi:hypothetical protein